MDLNMDIVDLKRAAIVGRIDGRKQVNTTADCMKFRWQFTSCGWLAYICGFYRGAGFHGSCNRSVRRRIAA